MLDAPRLLSIFKAAPIEFVLMLHVGGRLLPEQNPSSPQKVAAIKRPFPDWTIIAAHFGGFFHCAYVVEALGELDIYIDACSSLDFIPPNILTEIVNAFPRERILFGSDYPCYKPADELL